MEDDIVIHRSGLRIPATFSRPGKHQGPLTVVLMLHGTASNRDEVGNIFARQAANLTEVGIASLRIDFAGCGNSDRSQREYTVSSQLADAQEATSWLVENPLVDDERVFILGFSQGGMMATVLAETDKRIAGLILWSSGTIQVDDETSPYAESFLGAVDEAEIDLGFTRFTFSRTWWDEFRSLKLDLTISRFRRPLLMIAGATDPTIDRTQSLALLNAAGSADITYRMIPGADHIFNVLRVEEDLSSEVIGVTTRWLTEH